MTSTDDKPGIDERYAQAIESSHLEVLPTRCSIDYLIAIGWTRDGLGAKLYRLRTEFDRVRGEQRQAAANAIAAAQAAAQLAGKARAIAGQRVAPHLADGIASDARAVMAASYRTTEDAENAALTARVLMLAHLQTLAETREAVHRFAIAWATRRRFMQPDRAVHAIAGRALDLWLDPNCPHCEGRSFNGGWNTPMVMCTECDATGKRSRGRRQYRLASEERGHQFGRSLLAEMDRKADKVTSAMRRYLYLNQVDEATWGPAQAKTLHTELANLRSAQAQED